MPPSSSLHYDNNKKNAIKNHMIFRKINKRGKSDVS